MKKIQLFVPTYHIDECLAEIRQCLEIGWTGMGFKTVEFEEAWKKYTGLPQAHFLNSSTIGLQLAVKIYKTKFGWLDGDEIITTPLTFISTNHVILFENLKPIFADTDDTLCLSPEAIKSKITPRTKAVMYVGMGGNAGRLKEVRELCKKNNLILILDAAHMAGAKYLGQQAGSDIDCAVFSYHAVKNLPTADSGMICFQEKELDEMARKMSWLGISKDTYARSLKGEYKWLYDVEYLGVKGHGNSVMAAIALVQLKYLDQDNEKRRQICEQYNQLLSVCPEIKFVEYLPDCVSSRHLFQIRVPADLREKLIVYLNSQEIYPGVHYRINTEYKMYSYGLLTCPNAEQAAREVISLPLHLQLTEEDVARVAQSVIEFFEKNKI
ncbi:DegT/DnrJ/EryC1/StrS family aminotransferase [Candidatus Falkowbacteria bacterium]|nr:DegT/DnrJ/EryC1/StrS family aminotransferase [Candidatus Falkowbacteria bacterium]